MIEGIEAEMEYIARQNNPYTATTAGLRYLCALWQVEYSDNETDAEIRKRLLEQIYD